MTPKEKANELYDLFFDTELPDITKAHNNAKKYALIAVDEILDAIKKDSDFTITYEKAKKYWQQVKNEINLL